MAAPKKPKTKTMDVARPDSTLPDSSSRPLIVGNHAMIPDPMVVSDKEPADEPTTAPRLTEHTRNIQPVSQNEASAGAEVETASPPTTTLPVESSVNATVSESLTSETDTLPSSASPSPLPNIVDKESEEAPASEVTNAKEAPTAEENTEEQSASILAEKQTKKEATEKAAAAERAEQLKELVDNKTYFVPVHSAGQNTAWVLFLLFLVIAAGGAIAYMMVTLNT